MAKIVSSSNDDIASTFVYNLNFRVSRRMLTVAYLEKLAEGKLYRH